MDTRLEQRHQHFHDVRLAEGCLLCGGDLEVRFSPAGVHSYCATCRVLGKPEVHRHPQGVQVVQAIVAKA